MRELILILSSLGGVTAYDLEEKKSIISPNVSLGADAYMGKNK